MTTTPDAMAEVERLIDAAMTAYRSSTAADFGEKRAALLAAIRALPGQAREPIPQPASVHLAAPLQPMLRVHRDEAAPSLCEKLQQKCSDWGTYWRAPDAHGVDLSIAQAAELLQDALGVEVEIRAAIDAKEVADLMAMSEPEIDAELREHGIDPDAAAAMGAKAVKDALAATPEALAEKYIDDMVSSAPEPLRELGDYLSRVLDEDEFKTAERYVLGAMNAAAIPPSAQPEQVEAHPVARMLTREEVHAVLSETWKYDPGEFLGMTQLCMTWHKFNAAVEAVQRKFCEVNGLTSPKEPK